MKPIEQIPHLNFNSSLASRPHFMCIFAGDQEIYRIDDLDSFQAELGYTAAKNKKELFDEFIWSEYTKDNAPQSASDLQAKIVNYLVVRCQAFRQKYFGRVLGS